MSTWQKLIQTRFALLWIFVLFGLCACQADKPVLLSPQEIIAQSADHMQNLPGFHFVIERSGTPAYLDMDETIAFRRAEGDYMAPDQAQASIRVILPGLVAEVDMVSLGEDYWETNVLTGEWQQLPTGMGFNPAVLFDQRTGFQSVLENDLSDLALLGTQELEEIPGQKLYALTARVKGEQLYQMSYGMIGPETMDISLWVAPETFDLYRIEIVDPVEGAAEPTNWLIDFWNFGTTVEITPPPTQ
jgi:LppX_LprAFG lipoprotein